MKILTLIFALASLLLAPQDLWAQAAQEMAPPGPPPPNMKAVRALRIRFEREPTVAEVQQQALRFFKVHPERVASYRRGAAWKALMPDIEFTFNNEIGTTDRLLQDIQYRDFPYKEDERSERGSLNFGVRAHWNLDRLIFNAETLDVTSLVGVQEGLLREITSLYFTRRRLMTMVALAPPQDPNEEITEQLRLDEIAANLSALTGGYFAKELKRRFAKDEDKDEDKGDE